MSSESEPKTNDPKSGSKQSKESGDIWEIFANTKPEGVEALVTAAAEAARRRHQATQKEITKGGSPSSP